MTGILPRFNRGGPGLSLSIAQWIARASWRHPPRGGGKPDDGHRPAVARVWRNDFVKPWPTILIAGLLTGCAHFESRPLAPEKSAAQLDARRLDDAGLRNFVSRNSGGETNNWPPPKWDLNSLTRAAFYFHPDLAVARAQWRVADASVKTAGGRPNPTVTAGAGLQFGSRRVAAGNAADR